MDRIRDLGWQGVVGNTDEMLFAPESLTGVCESIAPAATPFRRDRGDGGGDARSAREKIGWRGCARLPRVQIHGPHGAGARQSRKSLARSRMPEASDAELESVYSPLGQPIAIYAHIHRSLHSESFRE